MESVFINYPYIVKELAKLNYILRVNILSLILLPGFKYKNY